MKKAGGARVISLEEVQAPHISPDAVLINMKAIGVCGAHIHIYHEKPAPGVPPLAGGKDFAETVSLILV